jgi:hypothetical protein
MNKAVIEGINEIIDEMKESEEFKRRFERLVEQIMEKPIDFANLDEDIIDLLELED